MCTGTRVAIALTGAVALAAAGFAIFLVTRALVASGAQETAAAPPEGPTPAAGPTTTTPVSAGEEIPRSECGEIATTDAAGNPLGALEPLVRGIHDAACRRDYAGLLPYMESTFNALPKQEVVAEWQREDVDGLILRTVAETLETPPVGDQGGQFFCHPDGPVAVFPRGTITRRGMWSRFDLTGRLRPAVCDGAR